MEHAIEPTVEEVGIVYVVATSGIDNMTDLFRSLSLPQIHRAIDCLQYPPKSGIFDSIATAYRDNGADFDKWRKQVNFIGLQQNPHELEQMLAIAQGRHSFLEVGSCYGGTLWNVSTKLAPCSKIVSVDFQTKEQHYCHDPKKSLNNYARQLRELGHSCELIDADSQDAETVERVRSLGPFEFGFIDADHSYEGVKKDWENYGPMCKVVGFHDIAGDDEGCVRFWNEIKHSHAHKEIVDTSVDTRLGIGIIFKE